MNYITPAEVFHPGDYVKLEIEARGWTQAHLAEIVGCTLQTIGDIISGKRSITQDTATGLAAAFGTSAQVWINLQTSYDLLTTNHRITGSADSD